MAMLAMVALAVMPGAQSAHAQVELLPLDHPATGVLVRLYQWGAIQAFPREHLPISRGQAYRYLVEAVADVSVPEALRHEAAYYRDELAADIGGTPTAVLIATTDSSKLLYDRPFAGYPLAIAQHRDSALGVHVALEPVLDAELRHDPDRTATSLIAQGGVQLRGTLGNHVGFSARVTNGSIAGDSLVAARDPRILCNGSFGVTGFGRDISFGDGHLRADFDNVSFEIGRERMQLGAGLDASLFVGSHLPCNYDYLRFNAHLGRFTFTHLHASLLVDAAGTTLQGPFSDIPAKFLAAHLLSFGPFAGMRWSIGESVIYHGRGFEIGYLNPLVFMKTQEQYLRDRDNANLYLAMTAAPAHGLLLEGEMLVDDLRFSQIGEGFWNNKTAWRVAARTTALVAPWLDASVSYTRLEPYVFTHFNRLNNYTHAGMLIAGADLDPNSYMAQLTMQATPAPNLLLRLTAGMGEHGANVIGKDSTGADTLLVNAGGDLGETHRAIIDPTIVTFLGGELHTLTRLRLEAEYEPLRNLYLRLEASYDRSHTEAATEAVTELRFGVRVGAH